MVTRRAQRPQERPPFFAESAPSRPRPSMPSRPASGSSGGTVRLTGRGGVLAIVAVSFIAALAAHLFSAPVVNGVAFVAVCVLAALLVRPADLLSLTVSPPLAYFTAALLAEAALTLGSPGFLRGVAVGMATRLADVAPWLFGGTALVLVISLLRGLPGSIRDFSDEVNGRTRRTHRNSGR
ncbi:MAG: hypothetical protein M0026_01065 [Nocardiopsaceae bacterium]|nr:hypothetical protein [Nocardiopsaceae bacterium]